MIDTHMHLTMEEFDDDRDKILEHLEQDKIECAVEVGYDIVSSMKAVKFAESNSKIYAAIGVHPHDADKVQGDWISFLKEMSKNPKVVAIGEIGLDYYRDLSPRETQSDVFSRQLSLAESLNMPVIFHIRDAYFDAKRVMKKHDVRGVVHSFNGSREDAKDFIKMGFYIGVGGIATYKRNDTLREIISQLPLSKILTETDSPYLSPQPVRGKRNEPRNVRFVIELLSQLFNTPFERVEEITVQNAKKLFDIEKFHAKG